MGSEFDQSDASTGALSAKALRLASPRLLSRAFPLLIAAMFLACMATGFASEAPAGDFPRALESYPAQGSSSILEVLRDRIRIQPSNLVATIIFALAIIHTFMAPVFLRFSHRLERRHKERGAEGDVSFLAEIFHFLGEIEAIFGIWVVPLLVAITAFHGWPAARDYLAHHTNFTEPLFVVVIMTMAASRPVLRLAERLLSLAAALGGGSVAAWWLSILTFGPLLGSFITEPAAITISALLLAEKFYSHKPSAKLAYATLGLLFVNVSVGGTLTPFAAPPVLMVSHAWGWGMSHMLREFGWKAAAGIVAANALYFSLFWKELRSLVPSAVNPASSGGAPAGATMADSKSRSVPLWITAVHILFLAWTVLNSHYPALFIGGFLFYLAFTQATEHHQDELALRPALLVGFFLAGLVVHGGLQGWWLGPLLSRLSEVPLFFGALALTAFNDNAAITFLASLVPSLTASLKYAVVAGAVAGGGLTVIANAPNPAGQSILSRFFPEGVSPLGLLLGALLPTALVAAAFLLLGSL
jgi:hypothetical protein